VGDFLSRAFLGENQMATYVVTPSETDNWGDDTPGARRFKYKSEAEAFLEHEREAGRFARLGVFDKNQFTELKRVNSPGLISS
jgi:hypothetical protein